MVALRLYRLGAEFPYNFTYYDAYTALREYGIGEEPRKLLQQVKCLELIEMKDTETCCGSEGTFAAKFRDIS